MNLSHCQSIIVSCSGSIPGIVISYGPNNIFIPADVDIPRYLQMILEAEKRGELYITCQDSEKVVFKPNGLTCESCGSIVVKSGNYFICLNCGKKT